MTRQQRLEAAWYGQGRAPWWAAPLSGIYRAITALRRGLYRAGMLRATRVGVPVIVVGNLTAGGTGKTPLTIALAIHLRAAGWRPGVVSRGYGGSEPGPLLLGEKPDPARVGDEPCLIHTSGVPVAIGRKRAAAAALLVDAGCNVLLADDGLQHYALARDVEICVVDGTRRFGNGRLLPAGPLREPHSRLRKVDFVLCNGGAPAVDEFAMKLIGDTAVALADARRQPLDAWAGQSVHAIAAIGNPTRFFDSLRAHGLTVYEHAFPDHHAFAPGDLAFGDNYPVLMTDKDAIKCSAFAHANWWRVPVEAKLADAFFDQLQKKLPQPGSARSAVSNPQSRIPNSH